MTSATVLPWGIHNSKDVNLYTLTAVKGNDVYKMTVTNYGATWVSWTGPGADGSEVDVLVGFSSLQEYIDHTFYSGCIVGRVANRIAKGKFTLNGEEHQIALTNGPNSLHGGKVGFNKYVWSVDAVGASSITLSMFSKDGDENFPGDLTVTVKYTLTPENEVVIEYAATTGDKDTVINLTNHAYFNLHQGGDVLEHQVEFDAARMIPTDSDSIPFGRIEKVSAAFDFSTKKPIGKDINDTADEQIVVGKGYDHCYVIDGWQDDQTLRRCAVVYSADGSRRALEVRTTEPGVQFYTGNWLPTCTAKTRDLAERHAFALETQHFPNSANEPSFPSTVLKKHSTATSKTTYRLFIHD